MAISIIGRLRSRLDSLSNTDHRIAQLAIDHPASISEMTIKELASATGVSTASISRFVKRIGYNNYREFTMELAQAQIPDGQATLFRELQEGDSLATIANKTFHSSIMSLDATNQALDENELGRAVLKLINAQSIVFFGLGGSSIAALDGYHKFLRTSLNVAYYPDFDFQLMQAAKLSAKDCAVVISHSGKNNETLMIVDELQKNEVPIIGITSYSDSPLAQRADVSFLSLTEEVNYRSEGMYSLISQLAILDSLFMMTVLRISSRTETVLNQVRQVIHRTREEP